MHRAGLDAVDRYVLDACRAALQNELVAWV